MTGGRGGGGGGPGSEANKALFLEKVRQSNSACQAGDFDTAISLYSEAIAMDKNNHILYSNRYFAIDNLSLSGSRTFIKTYTQKKH